MGGYKGENRDGKDQGCDGRAQDAIAKLSHQMECPESGWSDWDIVEDPGFCELRNRVEALEGGSSKHQLEARPFL